MKLLNRIAGLGLVAALFVGAGSSAVAQHITVVVNGQVMTFDQPPVMRAGRVFVPMRAIFERLGATVVYSNGQINATTGGGRAVHLTIGSTQGTINGQGFTMDVAPFTIAGRTEVPLRFVAQSLGAGVNWDANSETVYIKPGAGAPGANYTPPANQSFYLKNEQPANGASVQSTHPSLHAEFSEPVNRDALRISVDGHDVTSLVYANQSGFDVTPNFELAPGSHHVGVSGSTAAGPSFNTGWSFTTTGGVAPNYLNNIHPGPGSSVGSNFTLSGTTLPGSRVHIVASGSASALGGLFQISTGTFQTDTTADGAGHFSAGIGLNAVSGGQVRVIITSTSPGGASVERSIVYSS
jgi:hypothetical protein